MRSYLLLACASLLATAALAADPAPLVPGTPVEAPVAANSWTYYYIDVDASAAELNIQMQQTMAEGDPDVYVLKDAVPTLSNWDRRDSTISTEHSIAFRTADAVNPLTPGRFYIGVYGYLGASAFKLTASLFTCPGQCSGHGACDAAAKTCTCNAGYATDQIDCSASMTIVTLTTEYPGTIPANGMAYFNLTLTDAQALQLFVELDRTSDTQGGVATGKPLLMIAQNRYPTQQDNDGFTRSWFVAEDHQELALSGPKLSVGRYFIVVQNTDPEKPLSYKLQVNLFDCPRGCSSHGTCDPKKQQCTCDEDWFTADCSERASPLVAGATYSAEIEKRDMLYLRVKVPEDVLTRRIELVVLVTSADPDLIPRFYLSPGVVPLPNLHFIASRLPLEQKAVLRIAPGDLQNDPTWFIGLDNRSDRRLKCDVEIQYDAYCGHGSSAKTGVCSCEDGWEGPDCSVATKKFPIWPVGIAGGAALVLGFLVGFFVKRALPNCCARQPASAGNTIGYNPMAESLNA